MIVDVFQFDDSADGVPNFAQSLRDEVIGQLATFNAIVVVADPSKPTYRNAVGYTLQGGVQRDGNKLRSILRLARRSDAAVIWANSYYADLRVRSILQIQADLGQEIATAVAKPRGHSSWPAPTPEMIENSRREAHRRSPTHGGPWALLGRTSGRLGEPN
ncbi:hypothetical protein [Rhizobium sp. Root1220]|uniref:hypothetical protein n=1 Tax=Rhizobium sp. Root1220 TaxID=1736432 RepID=UPI0006F83FCA|nr:hypothetical protein [Rhizobium sp. Root1220]KQV81430.1 hypothetical protein ASC90_03670 [Rhizobium sp. Root1220]